MTVSIDQTAGLATYDGGKWSVLISGPDVFNDPDNEYPCSLTVLNGRLYVLAKHITPVLPYYYYNQVWGCPFDGIPVVYQDKTR